MFENMWYDYFKNQITNTYLTTRTQCAFLHGQVYFACLSGLITAEQKNELVNLIPEY